MNKDEEIFQLGAERYSQYYSDIRRLLTSEHAAEVRWLTASLFALNAGGLASLANKGTLSIAQQFAGLGFWLGIFLAFCFVTYSQFKTKKFIKIIIDIENCWVNACIAGKVDNDRLVDLEGAKSQVNTRLSSLFSVGSFAMFSIALFLFARQI